MAKFKQNQSSQLLITYISWFSPFLCCHNFSSILLRWVTVTRENLKPTVCSKHAQINKHLWKTHNELCDWMAGLHNSGKIIIVYLHAAWRAFLEPSSCGEIYFEPSLLMSKLWKLFPSCRVSWSAQLSLSALLAFP